MFNHDEFLEQEVPSIEVTVALTGIGLRDVLVTRGDYTSIVYDDTMLTIGLNDKNPFRYGEYAVWKDDNEDVWLGVYDAD